MGLKYGAGESAALINALTANLSTAKSTLTATGSACDRLTGALGGAELSGKGYSAAKTLFTEALHPSVTDMQHAVESLLSDVATYTQADALVNQYGDLDEDRLHAQVTLVRLQRDSTERIIETNRTVAAAATALPGVSSSLAAANAQLETVLASLEDDLRELDDKIRALAAFHMQTVGLFTDPLEHVAQASRNIHTAIATNGTGIRLASLTVQNSKSEKEKKVAQLLAEGLTPQQVAELWKTSGLTPEDLKDLPPEKWLKLASLSGLPAEAQDSASRDLLSWALKKMNLDEAYALFGFTEDWRPESRPRSLQTNFSHDVEKTEFLAQLTSMKQALDDADYAAINAKGNPAVQLVGLGNHDGALVAGISFGNLDTASNIGVNVSGLFSSAGKMSSGNLAAQALYNDAFVKNPSQSYAVVNWIGYHAPQSVLEVPSMRRASFGGDRLADFLNGINASRTSLRSDTNPYPTQFNVYAHSYGSTTAVEALKNTDFVVSALVTYGSAGVENGTTLGNGKTVEPGKLNVGRLYATAAPDDHVDRWGMNSTSKSLDPRDIEGAREFSSREKTSADGKETLAATGHDQFLGGERVSKDHPDFVAREEDADKFDEGKRGYMSPGTTSLDRQGNLLATGRAV